MSDHADTIRRLLRLWHVGGTQGDRVFELLRALEVESATFLDVSRHHKRQADEAKAENQRLRAALTGLVEWFEQNDSRADDFGELWVVKDARAALDGTP